MWIRGIQQGLIFLFNSQFYLQLTLLMVNKLWFAIVIWARHGPNKCHNMPDKTVPYDCTLDCITPGLLTHTKVHPYNNLLYHLLKVVSSRPV